MAKTLNSICFTTLLLVLLFISAEIPTAEANCDTYLGEVTVYYPCRERDCEAQCYEHYPHSCKGECEHHDHVVHHDHEEEHCHCYGR
ncbi:hypothetical protein ISN44_As03g005450 [Arabidopsis suecica]|uniref:Defensin-like protein n=2 Tax=Arabidopsis TaxID=3701 RepID=A0A8T2F3K8_ARASU|nr:hypothetical protein ISN44_As03g005450 [Arabidopsis suecica]CAA0381465.1 unnamed protein product [Arabidopsis thaliana]CAD5322191.1 unnamed protein product [Arabidopsis thaliana]